MKAAGNKNSRRHHDLTSAGGSARVNGALNRRSVQGLRVCNGTEIFDPKNLGGRNQRREQREQQGRGRTRLLFIRALVACRQRQYW
jgi:hypothetical protein